MGRLTLPRHLHRAVLRLLRPAEAAARRLVIASARGIVVPPTCPATRLAHTSDPKRPSALANRLGTGILMPPAPSPTARAPLGRLPLPLFDRLRAPVLDGRRHPRLGVPRISVPGLAKPFPVTVRGPLSPDDPIDAARLRLRLRAVAAAPDDLPAAARRFARWQASRRAADARDSRRRRRRLWPLKPGRPPGWRKRPVHDVHEVLNEAHWLALTALERPDTS